MTPEEEDWREPVPHPDSLCLEKIGQIILVLIFSGKPWVRRPRSPPEARVPCAGMSR